MPQMPRRSARPPNARPCALWLPKASRPKPPLSSSGRAISWCGSGPKSSTQVIDPSHRPKSSTQVINALRGHLAEFGIVVAKGPAHVPQLVQAVENPDEPLPEIARPILQILIDTLHRLDEQIADLDREIVQRAKADETAHRLMTIPGIGPVTAAALTALAPPAQTFRRGRDFAAWVGLIPLQHSTGGKQKLGATSKDR